MLRSSLTRIHRLLSGLAIVIAIPGAGCGSEKAASTDPHPPVCAANWQVIFSPDQGAISLPPTVLRWHDGRLYTAPELDHSPRIFSIPDTGGDASTVYEGEARDFWTEGDQLLHASTGDPVKVNGVFTAPTLLYSTPLAGGPSQVVRATHFWETPGQALVWGWGLDREALYWTRQDYTPDGPSWSLWRALRDLDGDQNLGTLVSGRDHAAITTVVPLEDRLIAYSDMRLAADELFSVPKNGGAASQLPSSPYEQIVGVAQDGTVFFQRYAGGATGEARADHYEVGRLRPGAAAAEPFWVDKPPAAYPLWAGDDGQGGSLFGAWEWGTDDGIHLTIWAVDADGHGTRLACDPVIETMIGATAVSPDALFVVVRYSNQYWEIARVARTP